MPAALAPRSWVPPVPEQRTRDLAEATARDAQASPARLVERVEELARRNRQIHDADCLNLNPATNVMNPRAEALLAAGGGLLTAELLCAKGLIPKGE